MGIKKRRGRFTQTVEVDAEIEITIREVLEYIRYYADDSDIRDILKELPDNQEIITRQVATNLHDAFKIDSLKRLLQLPLDTLDQICREHNVL